MNSARRLRTPITWMVGGAALTLLLSGCSAPASGAADTVSIVASTSVYGQIASEIAGDAASVTSIIDSSVNDPHSYEASARDKLAVSRADIVIVNGAGYDSFMETLLADATSPDRSVLNVSELSGLLPGDEHVHEEGEEHSHEHADEATDATTDAATDSAAESADEHDHEHIEGFNEHLWYNFDAMRHLAEAIEADLSERDPAHAADFAANAKAFDGELSALEARASELASQFDGTPVAITEPVPLYLLEAAGLHNETPASFSEAIEEGDDVAPRVLRDMIDIINTPVALLAYNQQTASPQTELVREAALAASVPVVNFAETLPDESSYISWMNVNVDALSKALSE